MQKLYDFLENHRKYMENRKMMYLLLKIVGESWKNVEIRWKIVESCIYC